MPLIEVKNIIKEYETAHALRGVSMNVEKGQWVSIMGASGSGKSTLLNIIGGLDTASSGDVFIHSTNIESLTEDELALFRREKVGFIFQQSHLIPYLTALENVMLAQYFHSLADEHEAAEALKRVGLGQRLQHRPSQLSGGEQQRICIARALINSPEILLADEPTGNLDRENTKVILELLKSLHNEDHFTIVLVTHDPFVSKWGERMLMMEDGHITGDERIKGQDQGA
ncbi:MAG: ABC transporter ATP-binding protein [Nitrospiraceae bacterium]|nr:MAG: ABC transporter ATP-binding protein [Nitrospiraceae bacterium]